MKKTSTISRKITTGLAAAAIVTTGFCQPAMAAQAAPTAKAPAELPVASVAAKAKTTVDKAKTTANLNLRTGASTDDEVLEVLPKGTSVTLSEKSDGAWKKVTADGVTGWVHGDYLSDAQKVSAKSAKSTANLNFRSGPSTDDTVVALLEKGYEVALTGETDDVWRQAVVQGVTGWVHGEYLESVKPAKESGSAKKSESDPVRVESNGRAIKASGEITERTEKMLEAVNENFGSSHYYAAHGYRAGSKGHSSGRAIDFMIRDYKSDEGIERGDQIAEYLIEHRSELGVDYVIWRDRIWLPTTGWTKYSGSYGKKFDGNWNDTTLHMDHVHAETR